MIVARQFIAWCPFKKDLSRRGPSDFVLLRGRICAEPEGCSACSRDGSRLRTDLKQKNAVLGGLGFS
jgi:hypothetical protein